MQLYLVNKTLNILNLAYTHTHTHMSTHCVDKIFIYLYFVYLLVLVCRYVLMLKLFPSRIKQLGEVNVATDTPAHTHISIHILSFL